MFQQIFTWGDDGNTVTNYAQWASLQDYKNIFSNDEVKTHMKKAADLAMEFKPVTYNAIWTDGNND